MSVLIKGGRIVTATDDYLGDVFIEDERVSLIGELLDVRADKVIDAGGKYVIPGAVDPHTHMEMPFGGTVSCDDFTSGTISAAFGGTTSHVDFCLQEPGQTLPDALATWHEKIERARPVIMVDDETLFKTMQVASETGALVMVHAENGDAIDVLVKEALAEGKTEPKWHAATRPPITEGEATNRAIQLARIAGCPLYVVHVSCKEAIDPIARARANDWHAWGETCTQYLFIDETALDQPDFEGAKYVASPPLRPREHQGSLWRGLRTNDLSVVSTDHCPFCFNEQKELGRGDFSKIPNGIPGVEHRMDLLHQGVAAGELSLARWVEVAAVTPARMFGLYPRKGVIAPGSDADIVIYDPAAKQTLSARTHHMNVDYSAYEGFGITGQVQTVLSRGQVVIDGGEYHGRTGHGQFLRRGLSQYLS
jgi:dihydropyrimidinase